MLPRTFDPTVCCAHEWSGSPLIAMAGYQRCSKCGAVCHRDSDGMIDSYTAGKQSSADDRYEDAPRMAVAS